MSEDATDEEESAKQAEAADEQAESAESEPEETTEKQAEEEATEAGDDEQPEIEPDEQASIPDGIDPQEIEDTTTEQTEKESDEEQTTEDGETDAESESSTSDGEPSGMEPDADGTALKAGEIYVTLVQQTTNAAIRAKGKEGAQEVDRDHFEEYDIAHYFDLTMEDMGVGSDLEPHEALLISTAMAIGEPLLTETDVMDEQIGRMMDKAMNGGAAA